MWFWIVIGIILILGGISIYIEDKKMLKDALEQEIHLQDEKELFNSYQKKEMSINKLLNAHPKIIFMQENNTIFDSGITFLTNKALCFFRSYKRVYERFPLRYESINFRLVPHTKTVYSTKEKNVVGRAIVGGVLTGGVGAVVGAASGLSNGGKKTVSTTVRTGEYRFEIYPKDSSSGMNPDFILIDENTVKKIGDVSLDEIPIERLKWLNTPNYKAYRIPMFIKNKDFLDMIKSYLDRAVQ